MVSAATDTAVSASISTPVLPAVLTVATMRSPASPAVAGSISTVTPVMGNGWHIGMSVLVCFAAIIPATRATAITSPLGMPPAWISASVSGCIVINPSASASRTVSALVDTSTIRAAPEASTCERLAACALSAGLDWLSMLPPPHPGLVAIDQQVSRAAHQQPARETGPPVYPGVAHDDPDAHPGQEPKERSAPPLGLELFPEPRFRTRSHAVQFTPRPSHGRAGWPLPAARAQDFAQSTSPCRSASWLFAANVAYSALLPPIVVRAPWPG